MAEKLGWDSGHDPPTRYDADAGRWKKGAQCIRGGVFVEGSNRQDIGKNQKRKNNSGGFPRWKNFGHQEDCQQAERPKTRLGKTGAQCGGEGGQPRVSGQVRHVNVRLRLFA
jgi:hypothetical protein